MSDETRESKHRRAEALFHQLGLDNRAFNALTGGGICAMEELSRPAECQTRRISGPDPDTLKRAPSFKGATDVLFAKLGPEELAREMDCAATSIRAARMDVAKNGYRFPLPGWEHAIARLARQRAALLAKLADTLT